MRRTTIIYGAALAASLAAILGAAIAGDDGPSSALEPGLTPNQLEQVSELGSYDEVVDMLGEPTDADENEAGEVEEATFDVGGDRFVDVTFNVEHGCEMFEGGTCFEGDPGAVVAVVGVDAEGNMVP